ncbi:MATE family efflux transporter [candidate division KSB1 bacterium]|nr:MATE family efflux transporter [candidate division KSB1 bacterium]
MTSDQHRNPDPPLDWHAIPEASTILPTMEAEPELTTLPLSRAIVKLAGPAMISMLLLIIFNLIDIWWVGKLGPAPLAGVSAASFIYWALQSVGTLISTGVTAMVARFAGGKKHKEANLVAQQGFLLAIFIALVFSITGLLLSPSIFTAMGLKGMVLHSANQYMLYIYLGLFCIYLVYALEAVFRGLGDTKTPLKIMVIGLSINIILDPVFIFGLGPLPAFGVGGAAIATVISHLIGAILCFIILNKRQVRIYPHRFSVSADMIWRISKIGAPIAFSGVMFSISYLVLTDIITDYGSEAIAALGLGHRIEGLAYFSAVGFAVAAEALVGQNLGASKPERAEKAAWLSVLYIGLLLLLISVLFYIFPEPIFRVFTDDPRIVEHGKNYLRIIAVFEIFLGVELVLEGAFSGAGNSLPPMIVIVPLTWLRIPLSILMADYFDMKSMGIWWAISITTAMKGIVLVFWFKKNKWKYKQV